MVLANGIQQIEIAKMAPPTDKAAKTIRLLKCKFLTKKVQLKKFCTQFV